MNPKPLLGSCDSYQLEPFVIEAMRAVIDAARCIRHWHDASNDGMVVSGEHVRALWQALADYDAVLVDDIAEVKDEH